MITPLPLCCGESSQCTKGLLYITGICAINTLRLRQNGNHPTDNIFICISMNKIFWISNNISLKCVPYGLIDNVMIGSDNGLMPNRQKAIVRTNDGLVYWCLYASLSLKELAQWGGMMHKVMHQGTGLLLAQVMAWLQQTTSFYQNQ